MTQFYFDEHNTLYTAHSDKSNSDPIYYIFGYEMNMITYILKALPVKQEILCGEHSLKVVFDNTADEAYFKILTADGIEI